MSTTTTYWYVFVTGDVDPDAHGPFSSDEERDAAAKGARDSDDYDEDGIFWLDITDGVPTIGAYAGAFFMGEELQS